MPQQQRLRRLRAGREQRVDDRERPAAHRVDVADVDHDREVAGAAAARSRPAPATCPRRRAAGSPRRRGSPRVSSPRRTSPPPHGPPRRLGQVTRRAWMSRLCLDAQRRRAASRPAQAASRSCPRRRTRRAAASAVGAYAAEVGLHQVMRLREQLDLLQRVPAQAAEERHVRALHRGAKPPGAPRARRADGGLHQPAPDRRRGPELAHARPAARPTSRRRPSPRCARRRRRARRRLRAGQADDRVRAVVPLVAIVAGEQPLLVAEDLAPQREVVALLAGRTREPARERRRRRDGGVRVAHGAASYDASAEQAPHLRAARLHLLATSGPRARTSAPTRR